MGRRESRAAGRGEEEEVSAPFEKFRIDCYESYVTVVPQPERQIRDISAVAKFVKDAIREKLEREQKEGGK